MYLNTRKDASPWSGYGLAKQLHLTDTWTQYNVTFTCPVNSSADGRLSFYFGQVAGGTTVWLNSPTITGFSVPPPVMRRDFECGIALLNGDTVSRTVSLEPGLQRLTGGQAPLFQYFVDDNSSAFHPSGEWTWGEYNSGYNGGGSEEVRPNDGFFHHWEKGAHTAPAGSSATFDLQIPGQGNYDLSMWWPAAVPARAGWASAMEVTVKSGVPVTPVTVDLRTQGGDGWFSIAKGAQLSEGATLTVKCPAGGGGCIADAILVESEARYNDGSAAASVTLATMDAIVLARTDPPAHCKAQ